MKTIYLKNSIYLNPKWQRKRLEIFLRDDFKCTKCGCDDSPLHVHHDYYENGLQPWEYEDEYMRTYCEYCHQDFHLRKAA